MSSCLNLLGLLMLSAWAGAGCSNPTDDSANHLPTVPEDLGLVDRGASDAGVELTSCGQVGDIYRFDTMEMVTLGGAPHPLTGVLNALWKADIERAELNVVFEVTEITATTVTMDTYNGARLEQGSGAFCRLPATSAEMVFERGPTGLRATGRSPINVFAGTTAHPKNCAPDLAVANSIPVRDVQLTLNFDDDCASFRSAGPQGALLFEADLGRICTCLTSPNVFAEQCEAFDPDYDGAGCAGCSGSYQNLLSLMKSFQGIEFDCEGAEGEAALCAEVEFTGALIPRRPPVCE